MILMCHEKVPLHVMQGDYLFLTCLYFHMVVATPCITFDVYAGIAELGFLTAANLVLSDFLSLYTSK